MLGLAHERALGVAVEAVEGGRKKKMRPVYSVLIKRKKKYVTKDKKGHATINLNSYTTIMPLKKSLTKAAKVIQDSALI